MKLLRIISIIALFTVSILIIASSQIIHAIDANKTKATVVMQDPFAELRKLEAGIKADLAEIDKQGQAIRTVRACEDVTMAHETVRTKRDYAKIYKDKKYWHTELVRRLKRIEDIKKDIAEKKRRIHKIMQIYNIKFSSPYL